MSDKKENPLGPMADYIAKRLNQEHAYPASFTIGEYTKITHFGMTLLDYFAGQALAGILANPECMDMGSDYLALSSYSLANRMLEERKKYQKE